MSLLRAVLAGLFVGAFASLNFAPLALPGTFILALVAIFALLRWNLPRLSRSYSALLLASFALTLFGFSTWWFNAVSFAAWAAMTALNVIIFAFMGWGFSALIPLRWWPLWAASLWTVVEILRGRIPFDGFPWLRLVHTTVDTPIDGVVRWLGSNGTTWLMALIAGIVVAAAYNRSWKLSAGVAALAVLAAVAPTGLSSPAGTLGVAAIQGNTPGPFGTWRTGEILDLHLEETARLTEPVDLVIWPENASDIDIMQSTSAGQSVTQAARNAGAPILVGAILNGPDSDTALNASVPVTPEEGVRSDVYVKQFLVPYGEYVPFRSVLGNLVPRFDREIPRDMIPGQEPGAMDVAGTIVGTTICWDIAQDRAVYGSVKAGASFIAVQTSNATFADFGRGVQPQQQWAISRLRAIETGRWAVVASTNGISGFINPHGDVVEQLPSRTAATAVQTIDLASGETWATRLGFPVSWLIGVMALAGLIAGKRHKRKEHV